MEELTSFWGSPAIRRSTHWTPENQRALFSFIENTNLYLFSSSAIFHRNCRKFISDIQVGLEKNWSTCLFFLRQPTMISYRNVNLGRKLTNLTHTRRGALLKSMSLVTVDSSGKILARFPSSTPGGCLESRFSSSLSRQRRICDVTEFPGIEIKSGTVEEDFWNAKGSRLPTKDVWILQTRPIANWCNSL